MANKKKTKCSICGRVREESSEKKGICRACAEEFNLEPKNSSCWKKP